MPLRNKLFVFAGLFLLLACGNQEQERETVDFEDFLPKSERDYNYDDKEEVEEVGEPIHLAVKLLSELLSLELVQPERGRHFPNRFSYQSHEDYLLIAGNDTLHYSHWYYADSLRTTTTLFNWMDCFGGSCQALRFNDNVRINTPRYFALWATDTALVFLHSDKRFPIDKWNDAMQQVYFPEEHPNYHFYQLGREIEWWSEGEME